MCGELSLPLHVPVSGECLSFALRIERLQLFGFHSAEERYLSELADPTVKSRLLVVIFYLCHAVTIDREQDCSRMHTDFRRLLTKQQ